MTQSGVELSTTCLGLQNYWLETVLLEIISDAHTFSWLGNTLFLEVFVCTDGTKYRSKTLWSSSEHNAVIMEIFQ